MFRRLVVAVTAVALMVVGFAIVPGASHASNQNGDSWQFWFEFLASDANPAQAYVDANDAFQACMNQAGETVTSYAVTYGLRDVNSVPLAGGEQDWVMWWAGRNPNPYVIGTCFYPTFLAVLILNGFQVEEIHLVHGTLVDSSSP